MSRVIKLGDIKKGILKKGYSVPRGSSWIENYKVIFWRYFLGLKTCEMNCKVEQLRKYLLWYTWHRVSTTTNIVKGELQFFNLYQVMMMGKLNNLPFYLIFLIHSKNRHIANLPLIIGGWDFWIILERGGSRFSCKNGCVIHVGWDWLRTEVR